LRYVFQALSDFAVDSDDILAHSPDDQTKTAEDVTREAMGKYPDIFCLPAFSASWISNGSIMFFRSLLQCDKPCWWIPKQRFF